MYSSFYYLCMHLPVMYIKKDIYLLSQCCRINSNRSLLLFYFTFFMVVLSIWFSVYKIHLKLLYGRFSLIMMIHPFINLILSHRQLTGSYSFFFFLFVSGIDNVLLYLLLLCKFTFNMECTTLTSCCYLTQFFKYFFPAIVKCRIDCLIGQLIVNVLQPVDFRLPLFFCLIFFCHFFLVYCYVIHQVLRFVAFFCCFLFFSSIDMPLNVF